VEGFEWYQAIKIIGVNLSFDDIFKGVFAGIHKWNVNEMSVSSCPKRRPKPTINHLHWLYNFLFNLLSHISLSLRLLFLELFNLLLWFFVRNIFQIALEVFWIDILLFIKFHNIAGVEVHMFGALEV
jgi:hypothetical protein